MRYTDWFGQKYTVLINPSLILLKVRKGHCVLTHTASLCSVIWEDSLFLTTKCKPSVFLIYKIYHRWSFIRFIKSDKLFHRLYKNTRLLNLSLVLKHLFIYKVLTFNINKLTPVTPVWPTISSGFPHNVWETLTWIKFLLLISGL